MWLKSSPEFVFVFLIYLLTYTAHINLVQYTELGQKKQTSDQSLQSTLNYYPHKAVPLTRE